MNFWIGIGLSTLFLIATIVVFATKIGFPHHRIIAMTLYLIGWIPFIYSIYLKNKMITEGQHFISIFFSAYGIHIFFGLILIGSLYLFLVIFPVQPSPFLGLKDSEIEKYLEDDQKLFMYLNSRLDENIEKALKNGYLETDFDSNNEENKYLLKNFWINHLELLLELDLLKERYQTFYQLPYLTKKELHTKAFNLGYVSFLAQHYYTLVLTKNVSNDNVEIFLNEPISEYGIEKNTYRRLKDRMTKTDEIIRLNTGRAYQNILSSNIPKEFLDLSQKFLNEIDDSISEYTNLIAEKPLDFFERKSADLWYPIQKQSAIQISYVRVSNRDYHIDSDMVASFVDKLEPGDILLERREWNATNVGIPGFWTHSAMYTGKISELNEYFSGLEELGGLSFGEYLQENYPNVYEEYQKKDESGFEYSVIESKRPGVILMSLEESANADSLAVLRVKNLSLSDKFKILVQSFKHLGKSYDYDFNFVTDNALVCSELVYKAYENISQVNLLPKELNGRLIFTPNDFAQKFDEELRENKSELELVLFLDGNEKSKTVVEKDEEEFRNTWKRPKWYIVNDFIYE